MLEHPYHANVLYRFLVQQNQDDLNQLIDSSNFYDKDLIVFNLATLEFAKNLGDKITIVNGGVSIYVDEEMAAVNAHGLFNLGDFLPKKPGEVELKVMQEMFEASVDGEAYDADRWSNYFRPAGMAQRTGDPQVAASPQATAVSQSAPVAPTPAPEAAPVAAPTVDQAKAVGAGADDILAMIRARQGQ